MKEVFQIKYPIVFVDELDPAFDFYSKMGFIQSGNVILTNETEYYILVKEGEGGWQGLALAKNTGAEKLNTVGIISSDDCIRDYLKLRNMGIIQTGEPEYSSSGLYIPFADPSGNEYLLVEERNYNSKHNDLFKSPQ